jgi:hypothetical protein
VAWILRLVEIGAEGEGQAQDVLEIDRPGGLGDIAALGLTLSETKQLLAGLQQEIVAAQVRDHAAHRPFCSHCGHRCRVKGRWTSYPLSSPCRGADEVFEG